MRRSAMFTLSTMHIPLAERQKIEKLISAAPRDDDGRLHVAHDDLVIEPHFYGFFVHCGIAACQAADPPDISPQLWALLSAANADGASWLLFDRDEPPSSCWPTFDAG